MKLEFEQFTSVEQLRQSLLDNGYEGTVFFRNPDFVDAIIGITDDGRLVYSYDLMVESLENEGWTSEDAIEWIKYNTIRALPYMGDKAPVVMMSIG